MKLESQFQSALIKEIKDRFDGALVIKNDPGYIQGLPDLLILYNNKWAALECKRSINAPKRPNQEYYVDLMKKMSYAAFISPENKEEILDEVQRSLGAKR